MKILIFAYASEPGSGSEYGVGWMVPTIMAKRHPEHEIYVVTRSRCKEKIQENVGSKNLHFLFYDIPSCLFYKKEMESKWGEQYNYLLWQLFARKYVAKMHKKIGFDVVHHLTFNQYRTPSPGFWMDIPFVMGPIGGAECIAPAFWQDLEEHTLRKETIRRKGKDLKIFGWLNKRKNNKKLILCSSQENLDRLSKYKGHSDMMLMPAIAFSKEDFICSTDDSAVSECFEMVYAGKAWDWKGIKIFLNAAKIAFDDISVKKPWRIKLIGIRFEEEQKRVMEWVRAFGLEEHVELIPFIARTELLKLLKTCNLSVYPAFRDSGSMSVLEASALGCPTICFDAGGQDIFPDEILLKIPLINNGCPLSYEEILKNFVDKLLWAYENENEAKEVGSRSKAWVESNLTWDAKVDSFVKIYARLQ